MTGYTSEDVETGRRLVKEIGQRQWELGDLALKVAPMGDDHAHNGSEAVIERFAEEIGVAADTLSSYREVAAAWAEGARAPSAPWTLYRELRNKADRGALLNRYLASTDKPSYRGLQKFLGKRPTPEITAAHREEQVRQALKEMPVEERGALVREALADLDTARAVVDTPDRRHPKSGASTAVGNLAHASHEAAVAWHEQRATTQSPAERDMNRQMSEASVLLELHGICIRFVDGITRYLPRAPRPMPEGERNIIGLQGSRDRVTEALAALTAYVDGGDNLEQELARILGGEGDA